MTEKRFDFGDNINLVFDNKQSKSYGLYNISSLIDLLNALHEENKQLKQQLFETSKELLWATSDEVDRALYHENEVEELRKEIFE